jgi:hypothetical protein
LRRFRTKVELPSLQSVSESEISHQNHSIRSSAPGVSEKAERERERGGGERMELLLFYIILIFNTQSRTIAFKKFCSFISESGWVAAALSSTPLLSC